jgi:FkbM family methyltransferase
MPPRSGGTGPTKVIRTGGTIIHHHPLLASPAMRATPLTRTLVSYLPSRSVIGLRRLADVPNWLQRRPHEADYLAFRQYKPPRPNVIDVGANRGQAIVSLRRVLREPKIWSFEPNLYLAEYIARRFRSPDFAAFPHALGASNQTVTLYVPTYGHTVWDTRASLAEDEARQHLNPDEFRWYTERRASLEKIEVEIRTLDEFDLTPDILKIDVEGAEAAVVEGGMTTIESHRPVILLEGDPDQPERLLTGLGYRRHRFDPDRNRMVAGESGALNTFLLRPDHHRLFAAMEIVDG